MSRFVDMEYLNGVSVKNCCTQEEISELDRLYQDYKKLKKRFTNIKTILLKEYILEA